MDQEARTSSPAESFVERSLKDAIDALNRILESAVAEPQNGNSLRVARGLLELVRELKKPSETDTENRVKALEERLDRNEALLISLRNQITFQKRPAVPRPTLPTLADQLFKRRADAAASDLGNGSGTAGS